MMMIHVTWGESNERRGLNIASLLCPILVHKCHTCHVINKICLNQMNGWVDDCVRLGGWMDK